MPRLSGDTIAQRKRCLAEIVVTHLASKGYSAEIIENFTNSAGHTDLAVVKSDLGLIHLTATKDTEPNSKIRTKHFQEGHQNYLVDKVYVAYGWNTKDGRTMVFFVPSSRIAGKSELTKSAIKSFSETHLNAVFKA